MVEPAEQPAVAGAGEFEDGLIQLRRGGGEMELERVAVRRVGEGGNALDVAQCGCDFDGAVVVVGHAGEGGVQRVECGDHHGEGHWQIAAVAQAPGFCRVDGGARAGEDAAAEAAEAFVERDVDGVRHTGEVGQGAVVPGLHLPQAGAVEMQGDAGGAGPGGDGLQIVPWQGLVAGPAQRQFEGDCRQWLAHRIDVGHGEVAFVAA